METPVGSATPDPVKLRKEGLLETPDATKLVREVELCLAVPVSVVELCLWPVGFTVGEVELE